MTASRSETGVHAGKGRRPRGVGAPVPPSPWSPAACKGHGGSTLNTGAGIPVCGSGADRGNSVPER